MIVQTRILFFTCLGTVPRLEVLRFNRFNSLTAFSNRGRSIGLAQAGCRRADLNITIKLFPSGFLWMQKLFYWLPPPMLNFCSVQRVTKSHFLEAAVYFISATGRSCHVDQNFRCRLCQMQQIHTPLGREQSWSEHKMLKHM